METKHEALGWLTAAVAGTVLWSATAHFGGRAEPWDSELYWTGAYPAALALSAVLGFAFPHRSWRWALALMLSQTLVMLAGGAGFGLLPLGMILMAVLSVPAVLTARVGARLRRWALQ